MDQNSAAVLASSNRVLGAPALTDVSNLRIRMTLEYLL